jgi:hypothetical protein
MDAKEQRQIARRNAQAITQVEWRVIERELQGASLHFALETDSPEWDIYRLEFSRQHPDFGRLVALDRLAVIRFEFTEGLIETMSGADVCSYLRLKS